MATIDANGQSLSSILLDASAQLVLNNSASKFRTEINRREYASCAFELETIENYRFKSFCMILNREYGPVDNAHKIMSSDKDEIVKNNFYSLTTWLFFKNRRDQINPTDMGGFLKLINNYGVGGNMGYQFLTFPEKKDKYDKRYFSDGIRLTQFRKNGVVSPFKFVIDPYQDRSMTGLGYWDADSSSIYRNYNNQNKIRMQFLLPNNCLAPIDDFTPKNLWEKILFSSQILELMVRNFGKDANFEIKIFTKNLEDIIKLNEDKKVMSLTIG
jgi:hypothetical protein